MKLNKIFLSLCFMVICAVGFAQTASDYRKAAEQGDAVAQFNLGNCYYTGKGVTKDYSQAVYWYRKAAEQRVARAQYNLGYCYLQGQGVSQDYSQAFIWLKKAAEQGVSEAQNFIGAFYSDGSGVVQDYAQAIYWWKKAAEQGNALSYYYLGICYEDGKGVTKDYTEAVSWYRKAAEQGIADAQYSLGSCYDDGKGVSKDYSQAAYWYRKAAEQGLPVAQYLIGYCYSHGQGVTKDNDMALKWLKKVKDNPESSPLDIHAAELLEIIIIGESDTSATKDHEYVDLGLSVLWAACNVGASSSEEYGNYFAWGEINPKKIYNWNNLKYCVNGNSSDNVQFSKYVTDSKYGTVDNKTTLELADDAANANWGGDWRVPTYEEVVELEKNCKCELISINGVKGSRFISIKNGNSIFLPLAGGYDGANLDEVGSFGYYWSSSMSSDNSQDAKLAYFDTNSIGTGTVGRYNGLSIRPVMEKKTAQSTPSSSNNLNSSEKVYSSTEVDIAPKFNGGDMSEFTKWVNQNVVYPDIAKQYGIKGRVITKFTIHSNGQISDIQILKGVDPSLDKEAINVLKKAPTLTPAKKGGENVAMSYMLPIDFGRL